MTNKVLRTSVDVFMHTSMRGVFSSGASERRMNPFTVSQFSVDGFRGSRRRGRAFIATRANRNRVANHRAAHPILAEIAVFERRRRATLALEFDPNIGFLLRRKRKSHLQVGITAVIKRYRHGAGPYGVARKHPRAGE